MRFVLLRRARIDRVHQPLIARSASAASILERQSHLGGTWFGSDELTALHRLTVDTAAASHTERTAR